MSESCINCKFFFHDRCRRYPPNANDQFPTVDKLCWCGEWQPAPPPPLEKLVPGDRVRTLEDRPCPRGGVIPKGTVAVVEQANYYEGDRAGWVMAKYPGLRDNGFDVQYPGGSYGCDARMLEKVT